MNSNSKTLIGVVLTAAAMFAGWALIGGEYRKIGVLKAAIIERDVLITERDGIMKNVDAIYAEYQARQEEIARFASVVPSETSVAEIVSALDTISARAGLRLTGISVQGGSRGAAQQTTNTLTIPVQLLGSYESFASFLQSIEKNLRVLDVTSINISPDPTNTQLLHFDIQLTAYFVK